MSFLLTLPSCSAEQAQKALAEYKTYLQSIRKNLALSAYEFASADWHYDFVDHRCPHDSWLEALTISEPASGLREEERHVEVAARLLGAFHDGHIELSYRNVRSYSLSGAFGGSKNAGHRDWLIDEVRLSQANFVEHEVLFRDGSRWLIESEDIHFRWVQG